MKNHDLNHSLEYKNIIKSRNASKLDHLETKFSRFTNNPLMKEITNNNKTFHNISNDNEFLLTELFKNKVQTNKNIDKLISNNIIKAIKHSSTNKNLNKKEANKNNFLKDSRSIIKKNKSIHAIIRNVEARSINVSPINSSFTIKEKSIKKSMLKSNYQTRNDTFNGDKDGIFLF